MASYLERFELENENLENPNRRCLSWENTIIIKARNREEAFRKAEKVGKLGNGLEARINGRTGVWRYEGLTSLLAIYEELEDGAEILWNEHKNVTVKKVKSWVKSKDQLEMFDDSEKPE
ncbi:MAG TPA: DUF4288 domain-containing protein [Blastocatellia bacterium]|nr:DUF4288 domain-containing protein [Blastocatellia bacterium]HMV83172.1 DUF4288 domain-containing protein [Blastocatellia bacterium]HMX26885.1 DUF4288 domain-containing protein [Blastocatellia bacterium]HMY74456.1 DUF4288 domain-containing protein [Blastocatellia bacterium]HMZ20517.1 DUF4288 domain-containing protein [Blastocatellia bacterium]